MVGDIFGGDESHTKFICLNHVSNHTVYFDEVFFIHMYECKVLGPAPLNMFRGHPFMISLSWGRGK